MWARDYCSVGYKQCSDGRYRGSDVRGARRGLPARRYRLAGRPASGKSSLVPRPRAPGLGTRLSSVLHNLFCCEDVTYEKLLSESKKKQAENGRKGYVGRVELLSPVFFKWILGGRVQFQVKTPSRTHLLIS